MWIEFLIPCFFFFFFFFFSKVGFIRSGEKKSRPILLEWARKLGLNHHGLFDLENHFVGPTEQVRDIASLVIKHASRFYTDAFDDTSSLPTTALSSSSLMLQGWPVWHRRAALSYLTQLAMNHVAPELVPNTNIGAVSHQPQSILKVSS